MRSTGSRDNVVRDFQDLHVWQKAHALTLSVYRVTAGFPSAEMYGLMSQTRRAAASIPANVAEGCGRGSSRELARFVQIARGSASELEYHLLLAHDLGLLPTEEYPSLRSHLTEVQKMLTSYRQTLLAIPHSS